MYVLTAAIEEQKALDLKGIVDEALDNHNTGIEKVLVVKRTNTEVKMKEGRDFWLDDYYEKASSDFVTKVMDAEDPLFILFTHPVLLVSQKVCCTHAGYMVYTAYTFKMYSIIRKMIFTGVRQI